MADARLRQYFVGYLAVSFAAIAVHPMLPVLVRPISYLAIAAGALIPLTYGMLRGVLTARPANWLLVASVGTIAIGDLWGSVASEGPAAFGTAADLALGLGLVLALAAALSVAAVRGRRNIGGLLDVAVISMVGGGLLWTALIEPRLDDPGLAAEASLLVNILLLTGLLGTLARLAHTAVEPIMSLRLLLAALGLGLFVNVALAITTGSLTARGPMWADLLALAAYTLLGAVGVHPSSRLLGETPPARAEPLSPARLAYLGAALAVWPVVGAVRQLFGLPVDGLLLALGTLATVPPVMLRIGLLAAERARAEQNLAHQAAHDPLTGLVNRAEFLHRLERALKRRAATGFGDILVVFGDLDGFKNVNDRLGHVVGDDLLVAVARRLSRLVARQDTLARYGGDEFLLLCESSEPTAAQASITRRIYGALAEPFDLAGERVQLGISVGVVLAKPGEAPDAVVCRADAAMYAAKQRRRTRLADAA